MAKKEPVSEADAAYAHAVAVCNRIVKELEEQLPAGYEPRRKADAPQPEKGPQGRRPDPAAGG